MLYTKLNSGIFRMSSITDRLAEALFLSGCVKFGEYRIKSGALSPYYIDLARLLSVPKELCIVTEIAGGEVNKGENILFFDDVISEGLSKLEGIKLLEQLGAKIEHLMVVIDREQGGKENLEKLGYRVHALAQISDLVNALAESRRISNEQAEAVFSYIKK